MQKKRKVRRAVFFIYPLRVFWRKSLFTTRMHAFIVLCRSNLKRSAFFNGKGKRKRIRKKKNKTKNIHSRISRIAAMEDERDLKKRERERERERREYFTVARFPDYSQESLDELIDMSFSSSEVSAGTAATGGGGVAEDEDAKDDGEEEAGGEKTSNRQSGVELRDPKPKEIPKDKEEEEDDDEEDRERQDNKRRRSLVEIDAWEDLPVFPSDEKEEGSLQRENVGMVEEEVDSKPESDEFSHVSDEEAFTGLRVDPPDANGSYCIILKEIHDEHYVVDLKVFLDQESVFSKEAKLGSTCLTSKKHFSEWLEVQLPRMKLPECDNMAVLKELVNVARRKIVAREDEKIEKAVHRFLRLVKRAEDKGKDFVRILEKKKQGVEGFPKGSIAFAWAHLMEYCKKAKLENFDAICKALDAQKLANAYRPNARSRNGQVTMWYMISWSSISNFVQKPAWLFKERKKSRGAI